MTNEESPDLFTAVCEEMDCRDFLAKNIARNSSSIMEDLPEGEVREIDRTYRCSVRPWGWLLTVMLKPHKQ